jgi:uncharacterized membrane protein (UPF0127 family)
MSSWWCRARRWSAALGVLALTACSSSPESAQLTAASGPRSPSASVPATTTVARGATAPAVTTASTAASDPAPSAPGVTPVGFELVGGRVTAADGETCDVCLWLAADPAARSQGLMGVTDLGAADGMVFRWDEPTTGTFWMRNTPLPLSIAFFGADGSFVSASDMTPCLPPTSDAACTRYGAAGAYRYAVEVPLGTLGSLAIGPGSRLELLTGGCPPAELRGGRPASSSP